MKRILLALIAGFSISVASAGNVDFATYVNGLSAASTLAGTELAPVRQGSAMAKATTAQIAAYVWGLASGDCTATSVGAITCTATNGVAFGTFATQNYATPPAIGGTTPAAGSFTALIGTSYVKVPGYATASLPTCNSGATGETAYTTDGTPAFTFCNGTNWVNNGGTTFTMAGTGCTPTAATGDATGGSFTLATGPCTAVTITFNGAVGMTAAHLWACTVEDETLQAAGTWFGEWGNTPSATPTTTTVIPIPAAAGATDTIYFSCEPH